MATRTWQSNEDVESKDPGLSSGAGFVAKLREMEYEDDTDTIALYHLNAASGAVVDSSHHSLDGVNHGCGRGVAGKFGDCFDFEESENDYIDIKSDDFQAAFYAGACDEGTMEFHIKAETDDWGDATYHSYFSLYSANGLNVIAIGKFGANIIGFGHKGGGGTTREIYVNVSALGLGTDWHHIRMTWTLAGIEAFIDSFSRGTDATATDPFTTEFEDIQSLNIGYDFPTSAYMDGYMDEIRISEVVRVGDFHLTQYDTEAVVILCQKAGTRALFDMSSFAETKAGAATIKYQYATNQVGDDWNDTWLTLAEMQAVGDITSKYFKVKVQFTGDGTQTAQLTDCSIDYTVIERTIKKYEIEKTFVPKDEELAKVYQEITEKVKNHITFEATLTAGDVSNGYVDIDPNDLEMKINVEDVAYIQTSMLDVSTSQAISINDESNNAYSWGIVIATLIRIRFGSLYVAGDKVNAMIILKQNA